jgi:hypothetical protein
MTFQAAKVAFDQVFIARGFDRPGQPQSSGWLIGRRDPPAKQLHGTLDGLLVAPGLHLEAPDLARRRPLSSIRSNGLVLNLFLDVHLEQALDTQRREDGLNLLFHLASPGQPRFALFADHQFPDGLLSLLQPFLQTALSRFARIDRLNDQTAFLPADCPIPFGDLHFDQRLISLCNAFRLVGFCLAHHLDQRRACRQIGFHVLSQGGRRDMQGRQRTQVKISPPPGDARVSFRQPFCNRPRTTSLLSPVPDGPDRSKVHTPDRQPVPQKALRWPAECQTGPESPGQF